MPRRLHQGLLTLSAALLVPVLMGAKGEGCGGGDNTIFSKSPAPDMAGTWLVSYDDRLDVEITLGGATYTAQLGAQGGMVEIDHEGQPFTFNLDCAREEVVCPSEVWPAEVSFRQDNAIYPHRVWLQVPDQQCDGDLVDPDPAECGPDTNNPECDPVCQGEVTTTTKEAFGTIDEAGENFDVALGVGAASNGVNCLLVGGSYVDGALETEGTSDDGDWEAVGSTGDVITIYTGGCLWAGDPNVDGQTEALVLAASVRFATGYSASKR